MISNCQFWQPADRCNRIKSLSSENAEIYSGIYSADHSSGGLRDFETQYVSFFNISYRHFVKLLLYGMWAMSILFH